MESALEKSSSNQILYYTTSALYIYTTEILKPFLFLQKCDIFIFAVLLYFVFCSVYTTHLHCNVHQPYSIITKSEMTVLSMRSMYRLGERADDICACVSKRENTSSPCTNKGTLYLHAVGRAKMSKESNLSAVLKSVGKLELVS